MNSGNIGWLTSLCNHSWVSLTWYELAYRVIELVSRVASCPPHPFLKQIHSRIPSDSLSRQHTYISLSLVEICQLSLHILYPGTLPPDPLETALFEDEDVRLPEERKFGFKEIIQSLQVTCLLILLAPDPRCFLYEGGGHHHLLLHGYHLQAGRTFGQFYLTKKQLSPACPTSWQAWPHPPASSACQESWDERTFIRGLQIWKYENLPGHNNCRIRNVIGATCKPRGQYQIWPFRQPGWFSHVSSRLQSSQQFHAQPVISLWV